MAKITGICYVRGNGKQFRAKPGASIDIGGMERTTVIAGGAVAGYTEKPRQSMVECTIAHDGDTNLRELEQLTDVTLEFETDTGITYIVGGAWLTEPPKLTADNEGEVGLKFEGPPAVEA